MSSNYKVISKHWATLSKCQYSFKHWQLDFLEGGKCIYHGSCFPKQWNKEQILWPSMKHSSITYYCLFATLKLVTYFPQFNPLSHKKWFTNEGLAEGNCYRTATRELSSWRKLSWMRTQSKVFVKILLLTLQTNGIQILACFPPFFVLKSLSLFVPLWKTT